MDMDAVKTAKTENNERKKKLSYKKNQKKFWIVLSTERNIKTTLALTR